MQERRLVLVALAVVTLVSAGAQQKSTQGVLKGGVTYTDQSSADCEKQNANNPYAGMDPLVCHGEMAPADSRGQCTLGGWQVLKQEGNTCYFCAPINPPIVGIIVPMDQVGAADLQGWRCGADQADSCMAICSGGNTYSPPPGTTTKGGPGLPPTPAPKQGGPPPGYAPKPGPQPGPISAGGNPCLPFGPGGYDYCANPPGRQPAGCICSQPSPRPAQPAPSQGVPNFSNRLMADAQTMLQNAGRISKTMTDSMDVTKHNNVGIGVALGAAFGATVKLLGVAAQQYMAVAAASRAAAQESAILQIAGEAASESGTAANQAATAATEAGAAGGGMMGSSVGAAGYMEGAVIKSGTAVVQGNLPTCAVLSCDRLAQLLGKNIPLMRIIETIKPRITLTPTANGGAALSGGLTAQEIETGLKSVGINAQVGTGMTNMMNQVRAGKPVIAGMYLAGASNSPLHAIVVEGLETQGGVAGLTIYDPRGWVYWQPIKMFQTYFTNEFVMPL